MNKFFKELILWILIVIPYVYLATIWKNLPAQVPTHFDLAGNPNDWSDKTSLPAMIGAMGIGSYLLMLFIPYFDPKKKIAQMGEKYYSLRLLMTLFMSALSFYLLYVSNKGEINPNLLIALIGAFYVVLGNYMQSVKPNYFIGIRTPWTLENEETWRKTHRLGGKLWLVGGLITILIAFVAKNNSLLAITFGTVTAVLSIVPIIYSYIEFRKIHKNEN
ncbi:MAG: SdpI family protein [Paludibacter sp.]